MWRFLTRRQTALIIGALLVVLIAIFAIPQLIVFAATITVNSTADVAADDGQCTLREAIISANTDTASGAMAGECGAGAGVDTIDFMGLTPATPIVLGAALPVLIDAGLTITGGQNVIIDGGGAILTGLDVQANNITISGLGLTGFTTGINVGAVDGVQIGISGDRNFIYGNTNGIIVVGSTNTTIGFNVIGYDNPANPLVDGGGLTPFVDDCTTVTATNTINGISLQNATGTTINDNVISCNGDDGIDIAGGSNTTITDNIIGFDPSEAVNLGNGDNGVQLVNTTDVTLTGNSIGGGNDVGVSITNSTTVSITGINFIGVGQNPIGAGNVNEGVFINGSSDVNITDATITFNGNHGVSVTGTSTDVNIEGGTVSNNGGDGISIPDGQQVFIDTGIVIVNNGGLGIDLDNDGVSANGTATSNNGQPFPNITAPFFTDGTNTSAVADFGDFANGTYDLHFYSNTVCDPTNFGEGETFLGTETITIPPVPTDLTLTAGVTPGLFVSVFVVDTATGDTSEFSLCVEVEQLVAQCTANPTTGTVPLNVDFNNLSSTGTGVTYEWDFDDGSPINTAFEPSHTFTTTGLFNVTLTVSGPGGTQATDTCPVVVEQAPKIDTSTPVPRDTSVPPPDTPVPTQITPITPVTPATVTLVPSVTAMTSTPLATLTSVPTVTLSASQTLLPTSTLAATETTVALTLTRAIETLTPAAGTIEPRSVAERPVIYFGSSPVRQRCLERSGLVVCERLVTSAGGTIQVTTQDGRTVVGSPINEPYVIKFAQPSAVNPGGIVTYVIRIVNPTGQTVNDVILTDTMPEAVEILDTASSVPHLVVRNRAVVFTAPSLGPGERIDITIVGRIRDDEIFTAISNLACVRTSGNVGSSCAGFSYTNPDQLPETGESPLVLVLIRWLLISLGVLGLLTGGFGVWWRWSKRKS